jgi:putative addiction module antidote
LTKLLFCQALTIVWEIITSGKGTPDLLKVVSRFLCAFNVQITAAPRPPSRRCTVAPKIFKTGNSLVVSLPPEDLAPLGLGEGAEVSAEIDRERGGILLTPEIPIVPGLDAEFARQVTDFIEQYRPALESLAKGEPSHG